MSRKAIILYVAAIVVTTIMMIILPFLMPDNLRSFKVFPNVPDWLVYDISFIEVLVIPFISVFIGYLLSPFFLWFHKKAIGSKMIYYMEQKDYKNSQLKTLKLFFPSLLTLTFANLLSNNEFIQNLLLIDNYIGKPEASIFLMGTLMGICVLLSIILVIPLYLINDAGIGYTNKEKVIGTIKPINIQGVGDWYARFLKGYAGIGIIFSLFTTVNELWLSTGSFNPLNIMGIVSWTLMPFLIMLLLLPIKLVLDKTFDKRIQYMKKWGKKLGITANLSDILTFKD